MTRRLLGIALVFALWEVGFAHPIESWTQVSAQKLNTVRFCNGMFIAVGDSGKILTSVDGAQWTQQITGAYFDLYGVTFAQTPTGDFYVVVGDNTILISQDATNWTSVPGAAGCLLRDVAFGTNWVAVGRNDSPSGNQSNVVYTLSATPTNWTVARVPMSGGAASFTRLVWGGGKFVVTGDIWTGIWTTTSGRYSTFNSLNTWSNRFAPGLEYHTGIAAGNGGYVAVGQEGPPLISTNGLNWTTTLVYPNPPYPNYNDNYYVGNDIAFGHGFFLVVGHSSSIHGNLITTTNGANWVFYNATNAQATGGGISCAFGRDRFISAGRYGGIFRSDSIAPGLIARRPGNTGPLEISLEWWNTGASLALESTSDFTQWAEVWRGTYPGTNVLYLDWSITNGLQKFFRIVTP